MWIVYSTLVCGSCLFFYPHDWHVTFLGCAHIDKVDGSDIQRSSYPCGHYRWMPNPRRNYVDIHGSK